MTDAAAHKKHPIQPLAKDARGVIRFKANAIVRHLLDNGGIDMNDLARLPFSNDDREQFAQLTGYSLSGFGDLSYVSNETYETAARMHELGQTEQDARIAYLSAELQGVRDELRDGVARLYGLHPDDLKRP